MQWYFFFKLADSAKYAYINKWAGLSYEHAHFTFRNLCIYDDNS